VLLLCCGKGKEDKANENRGESRTLLLLLLRSRFRAGRGTNERTNEIMNERRKTRNKKKVMEVRVRREQGHNLVMVWSSVAVRRGTPTADVWLLPLWCDSLSTDREEKVKQTRVCKGYAPILSLKSQILLLLSLRLYLSSSLCTCRSAAQE